MNAALSLVVQQLGIGACPHCLTWKRRLCPNPWTHVARAMHPPTWDIDTGGVCPRCEAMWEYCAEHAEVCPAVAIARLSVACKATGVMRTQTEVQAHVQTYRARREQFEAVEDHPETPAGLATDPYGVIFPLESDDEH